MTTAEAIVTAAPEEIRETRPEPAPEKGPGQEDRLETLLRRLEEQSALQTALAKKRLLYARLSAAFLAVTAIAVVWMIGSVIPQVEGTLSTADSALQNAEIVLQQLDKADIPAVLDNLDDTLTEGRESIEEASQALQQVSRIDFEGLNKAIYDLQAMLENPLGSIIGWRRS